MSCICPGIWCICDGRPAVTALEAVCTRTRVCVCLCVCGVYMHQRKHALAMCCCRCCCLVFFFVCRTSRREKTLMVFVRPLCGCGCRWGCTWVWVCVDTRACVDVCLGVPYTKRADTVHTGVPWLLRNVHIEKKKCENKLY